MKPFHFFVFSIKCCLQHQHQQKICKSIQPSHFISKLLKKTRLHPYFFLQKKQFLKLFETCKSIDPQSKFVSKWDTFAEKIIAVHLLFSWKWAIVEVFQNLQMDSAPYFFLKMRHFSSFSKTPKRFKSTQSFCQKERCLLQKKTKG